MKLSEGDFNKSIYSVASLYDVDFKPLQTFYFTVDDCGLGVHVKLGNGVLVN